MAILKDLIVNGASRFIGDAYFNTIKAGVWNGTAIDVAHGGTGKNSVTSGYLLVGNGNGAMNERLIVNDVGTSTSATTIPTSGAVYSAISAGFAANGAMVFKGTYTAQASSSSSVVTSGFSTLPGSASLGWTWIVTGNNSYFGNIVVEAGDMIISRVSNPGTTISNYYVIQTNIDVTHYVTTNTAQTITGAKTFNAETTFNQLSTFNKGLISTSVGDSDTDVLFVSGNSSFNDIVNIYGLTNHGNHVIPMNNNSYDLGSSSLKWRNIYAGSVTATTFTGSLSGNASTATTASSVAWDGVTNKPINFKAYSGSLASGGWKTMQGRDAGKVLSISYNNSAANWNSGTYSASLVYGVSDTRGLLDLAYNTPIVTFGGGATSNSTDDNPSWYIKLTGTSGTTYNLNSMPYATSSGNADMLDGYHAERLLHGAYNNSVVYDVLEISRTDTPQEIIIKTKLPFANGNEMPSIYLRGYAYGYKVPMNVHLVFYIYNGVFDNCSAVSYGAWKPRIFLFTYTEEGTTYVGIGLKESIYYPRFWIDIADIWRTDGSRYHSGWTYEVNTNTSTTIIPTNNQKEVEYASLATSITGSAGSVSWGNVTSKPADTGNATTPVYWNGSGFTNCTAYANASVNYSTSAGKATNDSDGNAINSTYLKKSGGTLTGNLIMNTGNNTENIVNFVLNRAKESGGGWAVNSISWENSSNTLLANIGVYGSGSTLSYLYLGQDTSHNSDHNLRIYSDKITFGSNTIWHAGNYTSWINTTNYPGLNKIGTVTSVGITAGTGISVSNSPITSSGNITVTNSGVSFMITPGDNRSIATTPNDYSNKIIFLGLKNKSTIGSPSNDMYSYLVGLRGWLDSSGGKSHEIAFNDAGIYRRVGSTTSWESWIRIADSINSSLSTSSNVVSLKLLESTASIYNTTYIDNLSLYANTTTTSSSIKLYNNTWTLIGNLIVKSLESGTYMVSISTNSSQVASGFFSAIKNTEDYPDGVEEIPLHYCGVESGRFYAGTQKGKFVMSSKVTELSARIYTITFKRII